MQGAKGKGQEARGKRQNARGKEPIFWPSFFLLLPFAFCLLPLALCPLPLAPCILPLALCFIIFAKVFNQILQNMASTNFKNTSAYVKGFALAMYIFEKSKDFPREEKYALTDQIRRSSRSVCANLAEAFRKKIYPAHFISKITDADAENSETQVWIDFAFQCNYLQKAEYQHMLSQSAEVGKLLSHMIAHPNRY